MRLATFLPFLALAAGAVAQNNKYAPPAIATPCCAVLTLSRLSELAAKFTGLSELAAQFSGIAAASGAEKFDEGFFSKIIGYGMTQTYMPITETNTAAFKTVDPRFQQDIKSLLSAYIATETNLAPSDKSKIGAYLNMATPTPTNSPAPMGTGNSISIKNGPSSNGTRTSSLEPTSVPPPSANAAARVAVGGTLAAAFALFVVAL